MKFKRIIKTLAGLAVISLAGCGQTNDSQKTIQLKNMDTLASS
ncbi:MAG TPA: hypothetical protein PL029_10205 [Bacteroidia bacterium]|nr:hypothetical protein [Bacteroidia bacterium]